MAIAEKYKEFIMETSPGLSMDRLSWIGLKPSSWLQWNCDGVFSPWNDAMSVTDKPVNADETLAHYWSVDEDGVDGRTADENAFAGHRSAVPLDAEEYLKALHMLRRPTLFEEHRRELCKLLMLGFKMELETIKDQGLSRILPFSTL